MAHPCCKPHEICLDTAEVVLAFQCVQILSVFLGTYWACLKGLQMQKNVENNIYFLEGAGGYLLTL